MTHRCRPRRATGDEGAALVEFAIIMPLVFALFLGMFTGGISLSRRNSMTNAVREGARLGATLPEDGAWVAAVQGRVVQLAAGDLTSAQVCVQLVQKSDTSADIIRKSLLPAGCSGVTPPTLTGVAEGECAVRVWASRTTVLQVVFFSQTITLDADAIGRYERSGVPATCSS